MARGRERSRSTQKRVKKPSRHTSLSSGDDDQADSSADELEDIRQHMGVRRSSNSRRRSPSRDVSRARSRVRKNIVCSICAKPVEARDQYRACFAHKACYLSKRCVDNMLSADVDLKKTFDILKRRDPDKYLMVIDSLKATPYSRDKNQRANVKEYIVEFSKTTSVSRKRGFVLLTEAQYVMWVARHEGTSRKTAKKQWQRLLDGGTHSEIDADGQTVMAIRKPTEIEHEDKVSHTVRSLNPGNANGQDEKEFTDGCRLALGGLMKPKKPSLALDDVALFTSSGTPRATRAVSKNTSDDDEDVLGDDDDEDALGDNDEALEVSQSDESEEATPPPKTRKAIGLPPSSGTPRGSHRGSATPRPVSKRISSKRPSPCMNDDSSSVGARLRNAEEKTSDFWKLKRNFKDIVKTKLESFKVRSNIRRVPLLYV